MEMLKRLHRYVWSAVDGPVRRHYLRVMKSSCLCEIDGVSVCDMSLEQRPQGFLDLTRQAMALVKSLDPRRYRRICQQLDFIVNSPLNTMGNYEHRNRICNVDYTKYLTSKHPQWNLRMYACLLIHEATHGVVAQRNISYGMEERVRIERLCHLEEYRFALRFESGYADAIVGRFDPDMWKPYWEGSRRDYARAMVRRLRDGLAAHFKKAK